MVMTVLHPAGEVGLAELPQPDSTIANPTHTRIRINILEDHPTEFPAQWPSTNGADRPLAAGRRQDSEQHVPGSP